MIGSALRSLIGHAGNLLGSGARAEALGKSETLSRAQILADLAGKSVAVVGNSRALAKGNHGANIDTADVVIRINRAPMPAPTSHGRRTDWLALATALPGSDIDRIRPGVILWMSHKRKRLRKWMIRYARFYLHPLAEHRSLADDLGAPPTTGLMVLNFVAGSSATSVQIYGFDFFASQSLTGRRAAHQVPHDFAAESAWVQKLLATDARFGLN